MENEPLVLRAGAVLRTEDTEKIEEMISRMFAISDDALRIPLDNRELENPLNREERVILKIAARRDLQRVDSHYLTMVIEQHIERLMNRHVIRKLSNATKYETFFQYCISFDNYIDHIAEWMETMLTSVEREEDSPLSGRFITDVAFAYIVKIFKSKIKVLFMKKSSKVRRWHSYLAGWAYDAAYNDRFLKVIRTLFSYIQIADRQHSLESVYIRFVRDEVGKRIEGLPDHTNLREFLANVTAAWNREWDLFTKLFESPRCTEQIFKRSVLLLVHDNYVQRASTSNHSYFSVVDLMTAEKREFDPRLLSDLFLILTHRDQCFINVIDELKISLSAHARENCFKHVEEVLCRDIDAPEWNFREIINECRRYCISYTRRWRHALRQSLREDQLQYLKNAFLEGVFHFIKKRKAIENIEKISKSCSEYLCGIEGPRQTHMEFEEVINFYRSIANRKLLARYVANSFLESIEAGTSHSLQLVYQFCEHSSVSDVPDELQGLLHWIKEAEKVSERINNENEGRVVQNANVTLKVSGTILTEKYRPRYEQNLLRKPQELVDIDTRFAAIAHQQCNFQQEQRLRAQNAESIITIRTNIFGTEKKMIRLVLTVYQYSIIYCLQRKGQTTVNGLCSTLKRGDIGEGIDLKRVRRVMKLVLMSLVQTYQMIKIFSRPNTGEIHPSRPEDISVHHYVVLNKELEVEGESLRPPKPDLREDNVDEVEDEIENGDVGHAVRVDPSRSKVAQMAFLSRCRARCSVSPNNLTNEEETISEVFDRLRAYGMAMQTIRFAVEVLIREGKIERLQEGGVSMLKFINTRPEEE